MMLMGENGYELVKGLSPGIVHDAWADSLYTALSRTAVAMRDVRRTTDWVRASCERDGLPAWLTALVVANAEQALLRGDFPVLPSE